MLPKWFLAAFLIIAAIGFSDATYLAAKYYLGEPVTCSILGGCEQVTSSVYATVEGVPVALAGAVFYLFLLLSAVAYIDTKWRIFSWMMTRCTIFGFLASLWFAYLQIFVLRAICLYCMVSALTSTLLFLLSIFGWWKWDRSRDEEIVTEGKETLV